MNKKKLVSIYVGDIEDRFNQVVKMGYKPKEIFVMGIKSILEGKESDKKIGEIYEIVKEIKKEIGGISDNVDRVVSNYVVFCNFKRKKGDIIGLLNEIGPYKSDIEEIIKGLNIDLETKNKLLNLLNAIGRVQVEVIKILRDI